MELPKTDGDSSVQVNEKTTPKPNGEPTLLGGIERDGQSVPVYYLGKFKRFTDKAKENLLKIPHHERAEGMLGVARSGSHMTMKVVVLDGSRVVDASLTQNDKVALSGLLYDYGV